VPPFTNFDLRQYIISFWR